jgi:glycosyltransferase involved in cell wall biosynthesis
MKLSICMMIKNEEKNLKRCLDSLENLRNSLSCLNLNFFSIFDVIFLSRVFF